MNKIKLKRSICLTSFFSVAHIGAIILLWQSELVIGLKLPGYLVCLMSLLWIFGRHCFFYLPWAVTDLWRDQTGQWLLLLQNGKLLPAELKGNSYIGPFLMVLNFRLLAASRPVPVVLAADGYDSDWWRRVRVAIKQCDVSN